MTIPPYPKPLSLISILFVVFLFFWIAPEDSVWLVSFLGWGMSLLGAAHFIFHFAGRSFPPKRWIPGALILGILVGTGAVGSTVLLMLMKTSLHNHVYPDYPFPLVVSILGRLPAWSLAGLLIAAGSVIVLYRRER